MKRIITLSVLFSIVILSHAQDNIRKVHYGISIMPQWNISSFNDDPLNEDKNSIGFSGFGDIYFDQSSRLQIKTGFLIQVVSLRHKDFSGQWPVDPTSGDFEPFYRTYWEFHSDYTAVGIPIEAKLKFSDRLHHFFISSGFAIKKVVASGGKIITTATGLPGYVDNSNYLNSFLFEPSDFLVSVTFGSGFEMPIGKGKLSISPGIEFSMNKFFKMNYSARQNGNLILLGLRIGWYL